MNPAQHILILTIRAYRLVLSPVVHFVFGPFSGCRFTPTCSVYALRAVEQYGALAGGRLALKRLLRCHPWGGCGVDEVPSALRRSP